MHHAVAINTKFGIARCSEWSFNLRAVKATAKECDNDPPIGCILYKFNELRYLRHPNFSVQ